jgi:hypothetical protein
MIEAVVVLAPDVVSITAVKTDVHAQRSSYSYSEKHLKLSNIVQKAGTEVSVHVALASLAIADRLGARYDLLALIDRKRMLCHRRRRRRRFLCIEVASCGCSGWRRRRSARCNGQYAISTLGTVKHARKV